MTLEDFKGRHGYEIDGAWLPRVTSLTSFLVKSYHPNFIRSAEWGQEVHTAVGAILQKRSEMVPSVIAPSLQAFLRWQRSYAPRIPDPSTDIERRVVDFDNCYAGTVDFVAIVKGRKGIVELKTSKEIWDEYALQTVAYLNAFNKSVPKSQSCKTRWILRIDQYEECAECLAKKRSKTGRPVIQGGNPFCNHQWSDPKGETEFRELKDFEGDINAFFAAKEVWEWLNRDWLRKIAMYPRKITQKVLIS